jgi:hypothetical protein
VALAELRKAIAYAEKKLQLHRLLLSPELRTHAGQVFLDRYVELINLSASGQLAMRKMFEDHLQRVEWDEWQFPVRLYPYIDSTQRAAHRHRPACGLRPSHRAPRRNFHGCHRGSH